jgi:uncharacterized protein YjiS (DUF1127 family)
MRKLLAGWTRLQRVVTVVGRRRARAAYAALVRYQKARADRYVLERLDLHTLRDIGLESWNSELAERAVERRRRERVRLAAAHIGLY